MSTHPSQSVTLGILAILIGWGFLHQEFQDGYAGYPIPLQDIVSVPGFWLIIFGLFLIFFPLFRSTVQSITDEKKKPSE